MRILFVAMVDSIHTARWINQLHGRGWDIHVFPVAPAGIHPELRDVTVHAFWHPQSPRLHPNVRVVGAWPLRRGAHLGRRAVGHFAPSWVDNARQLARTIRALRPDIIHSLEMQHAGYLTLDARNYLGDTFPVWMVTTWGSDIYLFGRLSEHVARIKAVLSACDFFNCDCHRDVALARAFGFHGEVLPVLPVTGSFDIQRLRQLRQPGPTSDRRLIVLKGYHGWAGRALVGLRAIELCADVLEGYSVAVYSAGEGVEISAELVAQATGIPIEVVPHGPHEEILRLQGRARIYIGLSISDGLSSSLQEAMVMGSFPIQSHTGCGNEWMRDGETALFVHPEDPEAIAAAIRCAVTDDTLVDRAAEMNAQVAARRLDCSVLAPQVVEMYESVAARAARNNARRRVTTDRSAEY